MNGLNPIYAVASPVRSFWTGKVTVGPRCNAPVLTVKGTGLPVGGPSIPTFERTRPPFAGTGAQLVALGLGGVMGVDQVRTTAVRIPAAAAVQGDPPRRTPPRC